MSEVRRHDHLHALGESRRREISRSGGRVEKFRAKFAAKQQAMNAAAEAAKAAK